MKRMRGGGLGVAISLVLHGLVAAILVGRAPVGRFESPALEVSLVAEPPGLPRDRPPPLPKASPAVRGAARPSPDRSAAAMAGEPVTAAAASPDAPLPESAAPVADRAPVQPVGPPAFASAATAYARVVWERVNARRPATAPGAGAARVTFRLARSGKLVSLTLSKSSGRPAFDRSALASVRSAAPFPMPPAGLADDDLLFEVEVRSRSETTQPTAG
ncbi:MAG: TonB family protein [Caulobacter sp.]|nr:TonB family protein [Caulobacter sp.]